MSNWPDHRGTVGRFLLLSIFVGLNGSNLAEAQVAPSGFFTDPVLVLRVGGHQGPVRSMVFNPGGTQLLTGGTDKVIQVWDLEGDRSGPVRTIRPPYWRGSRGQINALALSPRADGDGQHLLAVAGASVLGTQGEILFFRYPGHVGESTGDLIAQLPATAVDGTLEPGHSDVVTGLQFTPDGRYLASSSNDQTLRIWDVDARRQVAVLRQAQAQVNGLGIFANGSRLVSAGNDGVLRLYDLTNKERPRLIAQHPRAGRTAPFPLESRINVVAASPDGRWIVAGSEQGVLARFDAELARDPLVLQRNDQPLNLPVLSLGFSPDGSKLAVGSTIRNLEGEKAGIPTVTSSVTIRSMPDGVLLESLPSLTNLIPSLAFSPDGKRLAYSGGDAQSIFVKELGPGAPALPLERRGAGASLWDVGFRADGRAIRFARARPIVAGQGADYEYFDLRGRFFDNPGADEPAYRHARATDSGWTITPIDPFQLNFTNTLGQGWRGVLNPINDRRWWAYTVIPPGPGHPQAVAAVAADAGIVLWNLATGTRTRVFNGHSGPVYAIASSPDGKWLATGSADQTVRLWPLEGSDRVPRLGATFERRPDGSWIVADVVPGGFADGIALKKGHVIEKLFLGKDGPAEPADLATELPRLDLHPASWMISFHARMNGDPTQPLFLGGTTKRDSPALSLFPGVDRRWILWTPRGFYDSSADGDRKFLGWLTNRGTPSRLLASSWDSMDKFEARFRQPKAPRPNVIDRLLDTANPIEGEAVPQAAPPAAQGPPDPVTSRLASLVIAPLAPALADRPIVAAGGVIPVRYQALARAGSSGISRLFVEVNGRVVANLLAENAPAVREIQGQGDIPIGPDREARVTLVAVDERGVRRDQALDILNTTPPPSPRKSRLEVVAIGASTFADRRFPAIRHAETDAIDLAGFLADRIVDPSTGARFGSSEVHSRILTGGQVTRANLHETFDAFTRSAAGSPLGAGDVVVVVIESHYLESRSKRLIATTEPDPGHAEPHAVPTSDIADRLGELTRAGCRAIVLLDAVHEIKNPAWDFEIQDWVRQLQGQSRAIAFIAADHGASSPNGKGHRVFAEAILDVLKPRSAGRIRKPGGTMSLFDFERTVVDSVLQQTGRRQHAQCYFPDTIPLQAPFLDPSSR